MLHSRTTLHYGRMARSYGGCYTWRPRAYNTTPQIDGGSASWPVVAASEGGPAVDVSPLRGRYQSALAFRELYAGLV